MKTSYCLFTAAGVAAAALAVYTAQYPGWSGAQAVPPLPTRGAAANAAEPPAVLGIADGGLPPIVLPPDAPLVIPVAGKSPELPIPPMTAEPTLAVPPVAPTPLPKLPTVPATPTPPVAPLPVPPVTPPAKPVEPPVVPPIAPPAVSPTPAVPVKPVEPVKPAAPPTLVPPVRSTEPVTPPAKAVTLPAKPEVPVAPPPAAVLPKPAPLPQPAQPQPLPLLPPPTRDQTLAAGPTSGKLVVVKGNKLVEGSVSVVGEKAILRQGSFERTLPKADVLFVAETRDDVYHFMLAQVSASDVAARLGVARWCMFAGLREQALTEAKEILKLQPANTAAADMARSLEESIKLFPADGSTTAVAARPPGGALVAEPEPDLTPEGATAFVSRAQPVLANQCMECHARADYAGEFKLIRITGFETGPQSTNANMRSTATQIKKDDPLNSPLLTKSLVAHGGMKQPAFVSRQAGAYRVLEAWVLLAAGPVVQPMNPPTQPVLPATAAPVPAPAPAPALPPVEPPAIPIIPPAADVPAPMVPTPPVVATPPVAVPTPPVIVPPVDVAPVVVPPVVPVVPAAPAIPRVEPQPPAVAVPPLPIEPVPALPVAPPPAETRVPPVLPTPPSMPAADASQKFPKLPKAATPTGPVIPAAAALPKAPDAVQNAGGIAPGGQFGTKVPPKPPAPTGPAGGDEFDPEAFNKSK